ncbi:DUF4358 domain-containing protein [Paenibacillus chungangensis]|uniref:DUF4358 domain-containing protein n=1 Tax=Paenibacillus chungangensis TaxID=696535 RepID=A0ABW3HSD9_9BACL
MKKRILNMLMIVAMGVALAACGADQTNSNSNNGANTNANLEPGEGNAGNNQAEGNNQTDSNTSNDSDNTTGDSAAEASTTQEVIDAILAQVEQPAQISLEGEQVKDFYHIDPALLEDYTIKIPMMNVKTNELALLKVKNEADIQAVVEGIEKRAENVQKQFETYLQDQYENAKNYKVETKGNYVLFVISEEADKMVEQFHALVK